MKLLLLSSLFSIPLFSAEMTCLSSSTGKIQYILDKKKVEKKASYCFKVNTPQIESLSCVVDCEAKQFKTFKKRFSGNIGSPGFKLCAKGYLGRPQILKYWDRSKWVNTSRCIFEDKSFIDLGRLEANSQFKN